MKPAAMAGCALAAVMACACGPAGESGAGAPPGGFDPKAATETAWLEGVPLSLTARAWLDRTAQWAGAARRAGGPLHVMVAVGPPGDAALPEGVTADRMWVIAGDHAWETPFDVLTRVNGRLEGTAGGGPDLDPALPADVVVRLVAPDGAARHLKVRLHQVPELY
jgi:hypothetical protein